MSTDQNNKGKIYSFKDTTRRNCMTMSIGLINRFIPIYPELLKCLNPEDCNVGIWIVGSKEIVEYINPTIDIEEKRKRLNEVLSVIAKLQSVSKLLIQKSEKQKFYDALRKARGNKIDQIDLNEQDKQLAFTYLSICDASSDVISFANKESIEKAEHLAASVISAVQKVESVASFLFKLIQHDRKLFDHASFTMLFALAMGKFMKLDDAELKKISLGCMFMDMGITQLDLPEYYTKALKPHDQHTYERHPLVSVEMLNELSAGGVKLKEEVFTIVLQHHERFNGYGFPNKKKGRFTKDNPNGIHLYAGIVALAERFTGFFRDLDGKPLYKPSEAIKSINRLHEDFDPAALNAFNTLVGFDAGSMGSYLIPVVETPPTSE